MHMTAVQCCTKAQCSAGHKHSTVLYIATVLYLVLRDEHGEAREEDVDNRHNKNPRVHVVQRLWGNRGHLTLRTQHRRAQDTIGQDDTVQYCVIRTFQYCTYGTEQIQYPAVLYYPDTSVLCVCLVVHHPSCAQHTGQGRTVQYCMCIWWCTSPACIRQTVKDSTVLQSCNASD